LRCDDRPGLFAALSGFLADHVQDLVRLGSDVERLVLSRAVLWHCEDRIIRYGNQTVIF